MPTVIDRATACDRAWTAWSLVGMRHLSRVAQADRPGQPGHGRWRAGHRAPHTECVRARSIAWTLVSLSAAAVALAAWVTTLPGAGRAGMAGSGTYVAAVGSTLVVWAVTGAILVALRPRNPVGWIILGSAACVAMHTGLAAYGGYGAALAHPAWPAARWAAFVACGLHIPGWLASLSLLLAFYPDGRLPARWWRVPIAGASAGIALFTLTGPFDPSIYRDVFRDLQPPVHLDAGLLSALQFGACLPLIAASTLAIWAGTLVRLAQARPPQRQPLVLLMCIEGPNLVTSLIPTTRGDALISTSFALLLPVAVTVAVLQYRMPGVERLLRRGLVYGSLTTVVIAVYLAVTMLAGTALNHRPLPGVLAAALVAVLLAPARNWLQRAVDQLVYGSRQDPLHAIGNLGDRVATADECDLLPAALNSVLCAVQAVGAVVTTSDGKILDSAGNDADAAAISYTAMPLRVAGREVGILRIAAHGRAQKYNDADLRLLIALSSQVAVLVRALELTKALEVERDRVVTAARSERDRLRRDLHDGLGPSLSGMGLGLQAALDALDTGDAEGAAKLLTRIREEAATSVGEVRRIIDGLRPTALDTLGLVGAIRQHAHAISPAVPVAITADDLPRLPPDVEVAAYRLVMEALTNIVRHSEAQQARILLTAAGQALRIVVADDGRGVGEPFEGVGLASMRRRAMALGGKVTISSQPDHGTTVVAVLPLADDAVPGSDEPLASSASRSEPSDARGA